jgi:hypothetical protein
MHFLLGADTVPIFLRLVMPHNFEPGPFRLTPCLRPLINIIAILWMVFIAVRAYSLLTISCDLLHIKWRLPVAAAVLR